MSKILEDATYEALLERLLLIEKKAYGRDDYKDHVAAKIIRSITHFYQICLANKLGKTQYVQHWKSEVRAFLNELGRTIQHDIRGFSDRNKAIQEEILYVKSKDANFQRDAETHVKSCYKMKKLNVVIDENDTQEFWNLVDQVVKEATL